MDVLMDPTFWGEVGLAAAARLAVLAAVVWVARMVVIRPVAASSMASSREEYAAAAASRSRLDEAITPAMPVFVNLTPRAKPAVITGNRNATHDRLMQYVQRRAMERTMP